MIATTTNAGLPWPLLPMRPTHGETLTPDNAVAVVRDAEAAGYLAQPKLGGDRVLLRVTAGGVDAFNRYGTPYGYYHCVSCHETRERKESFEASFVELLEKLEPTPDAVKMLRGLVLKEWHRQQAETVTTEAATKARVAELTARKDRLVEAYIHKQALDEATYKRHMDKLSEELTLAEMSAQDAKIEALDVEAALTAAEHVLTNLGRLWVEYGLDQRQRLQKIVFPNGLTYQNGAFGNTIASPIFRAFQHVKTPKKQMVDDTGLEPVTSSMSRKRSSQLS